MYVHPVGSVSLKKPDYDSTCSVSSVQHRLASPSHPLAPALLRAAPQGAPSHPPPQRSKLPAASCCCTHF